MRTNLARIAGLATSGLVVAASIVLLAPASHGQDDEWTYTCDDVSIPADPGSGYGKGHCVASNGAPKDGAITQNFKIKERNGSSGDLECIHQKKNDTSKASLKVKGSVYGDFCRAESIDH